MKRNRKIEIIIGVLFIIATVSSSLCFVISDPILNASDILISISTNINQLNISAVLLLINCAAVVAIPILLFPLFKRYDETLALGYLGSRIIESVILIVGCIILLTLSSLSQEYVQTAVSDASNYQNSGILLQSIYNWSILIGIMIVFSLTALLLNVWLYQSKLIPRWLSVWGLIGAIILLIEGLAETFGFAPTTILSLPIALQEMVFACWVIVKGFNIQTQKQQV